MWIINPYLVFTSLRFSSFTVSNLETRIYVIISWQLSVINIIKGYLFTTGTVSSDESASSRFTEPRAQKPIGICLLSVRIFCFSWFIAGKNERQKQTGASSAWNHQGERNESRREDQGGHPGVESDKHQTLGCVTQELHSGEFSCQQFFIISQHINKMTAQEVVRTVD